MSLSDWTWTLLRRLILVLSSCTDFRVFSDLSSSIVSRVELRTICCLSFLGLIFTDGEMATKGKEMSGIVLTISQSCCVKSTDPKQKFESKSSSVSCLGLRLQSIFFEDLCSSRRKKTVLSRLVHYILYAYKSTLVRISWFHLFNNV